MITKEEAVDLIKMQLRGETGDRKNGEWNEPHRYGKVHLARLLTKIYGEEVTPGELKTEESVDPHEDNDMTHSAHRRVVSERIEAFKIAEGSEWAKALAKGLQQFLS